MIDVRGFAGILDTDNAPSNVPTGYHMMANNGRFIGVNNLLQFQNVEGTRQINFTKPAGTNEPIGAFYDSVDGYMYWCNWNSNSNHAIYQIDLATETVVTVLQSNTNTDGDILEFDLDNPIHSMDLIYGSEGNYLCFVDSLGRPTQIDINKFINNPYAITKRSYIDVAKAPFVMPPKVSYENDENATTNNTRNALFQFRSRPILVDNSSPVSSSGSEVPLPYLPYDQDISKDATKNSRICVYVQTGDADVLKIQIEGRQANNGIISDWFKITVLDKDLLSIPDNSIYRFLFSNDSVYPTLPTEGTDPNTQVLQLQDYVPKQANTECLLNGNVLGYAGITEGYDPVEADMNISAVENTDGRPNTKNGILFFASQNSLASVGTDEEIVIYLSGVGDNDPTTNEPITLSNSLNTKFDVQARTIAGVDRSFSYTEASANALISDILDDISLAAQAQGYTEVSITANSLTLSLPNVVLLSSATYTTEPVNVNEAIYVNAERAAYGIGVQYFDDKGRTNGVVYAAAYNTLPTTDTTDLYELTIYHRPPIWATYYHVVRTNNTTFSKLLHWVSDNTISNTSLVLNSKFSYIGISNLELYNKTVLSSAGIVSYEFAKGDRIRFISRIENDGTVDTSGFSNLDYEVLGTEVNPNVNGKVYTGTYVKIAYPTNDISANFKLDGSNDFNNYHIILYSPAVRVTKENQFFFEFGLQYGIGEAGTANAYHAGMTQSQTPNLSQPAKILLDKGDLFYRYRNVVSGQQYNANGGGGGKKYEHRWSTIRLQFEDDVTNSEWEIRSNAGQTGGIISSDYPEFSDTDFLFYNKTSGDINIRLEAQIFFYASFNTNIQLFLKSIDAANNVTITNIVNPLTVAGDTVESTSFLAEYPIAAGNKVWLMMDNVAAIDYVEVYDFDFKFSVLKYTNIPIVEFGFSDYYSLKLSANSRVTSIDENAVEAYYPTRFRWGGAYLQNTNINLINRFYPASYDEFDRSKGDVRRLVARERMLKVFQAKGTGQTGIYSKIVQDAGGQKILTTTDEIITRNNINYYQGEYGIGDYPTSLVSTDAVDIFVDPTRGYQIISDNAGLRTINELYLGQYYIGGLLSAYNKTWTKANGSRAKIMGVYNYIDEEYNCLLEGGENGDDEIGSYNFSFNLKRKGYSSFFDWHPQWAISANDNIYSWKDGDLYCHDFNSTYCRFYGVAYDCNITLPFNKNQIEKKGWKGLVVQSNTVWHCPEIYTQVMSYGNTPQESVLTVDDFRLKEGMYHASFKRDSNSVKGINNGDVLKGSFIVIKFQPINSGNFVFLTSISAKFLDSPLVPK